MGKAILAKDIMSTPFYYIKDNQTVQDALDEMKKNGLKRIVVTNMDGAVLGTTDSWRLRLVDSNLKLYKAISEKSHILSKTTTISWDTPIENISPILQEQDLLVIKNEKAEKVGVVTRADLAKLRRLV